MCIVGDLFVTGRRAEELLVLDRIREISGSLVIFQNPEALHFSDFARSDSTFALQVRGDSMIEDHICSGDFVLVEKNDAVKNGDIVVALVNGDEATLKRYYSEPDGRVRLQPANATMEPIYIDPSQLQVQGRVLAVMRKY